MPRIPYPTDCRNTQSSPISTGIAESSVAPEMRSDLARGCDALLDLIRAATPPGRASVLLRQIDLAEKLEVCPATVRRRTNRLEDAGMVRTKRSNNAIRYWLLTPPVSTEDAAPAASPLAKPNAPKEPRPTCPSHKASRVSYMTEEIGRTVHHCTGWIPPLRCSWLHVAGYGQVRAPGLTEWKLPDLLEYLDSVDKAAAEDSAEPEPTFLPVQQPAEALSPAGEAWREAVSIISRSMQDHYVERYLTKTEAREIKDDILQVVTPSAQDAQWLSASINQRWSDQALSKVLSRPARVEFVHR